MMNQKTRNQRKRERIKNRIIAIATIALCVVVGAMMFKTWANEATISKAEHQAYIASLSEGR